MHLTLSWKNHSAIVPTYLFEAIAVSENLSRESRADKNLRAFANYRYVQRHPGFICSDPRQTAVRVYMRSLSRFQQGQYISKISETPTAKFHNTAL